MGSGGVRQGLRSRGSSILCVALLALYPALTPLAKTHPTWGAVGYAWILLLYGALCLEALRCGCSLLAQARGGGGWLTLAVTALWLMLISLLIVPRSLLSPENSFQIGCTLGQLERNPSWAFNSACFIGYPTRGYYLQSLPSQLFGMSHITANLGASLILFPGFVIFAHGLRVLLRPSRAGDLICACVLGLLFQSTALFRTIAYHDQTIQPFAITLCLVGLFFSLLVEQRRTSLMLFLGWMMLGTAYYPPVLPALLLGACALSWAALAGRLQQGWRALALIGLLFAALAFVETLPFRLDLRLGVPPEVAAHPGARVERVLAFLAFHRGGYSYAQLPLRLVGFVVLLIGVCGARGWKASFVSMWVAGFLVFSFFASGVSPYLAWFKMSGSHRALPVLPVLVVLIALELQRWWPAGSRSVSARATVALMALALLPPVRTFLGYPYSGAHPYSYILFRSFEEHVPHELRNDPAYFYRSDVPSLKSIQHALEPWDGSLKGAPFAGSCVPQPPPPPNSIVITAEGGPCEGFTIPAGYEQIERLATLQHGVMLMYLYRSTGPQPSP